VIVGTLSTLPELVARAGMKPPATIVIGEVVRLRGKLDWFGRLPLAGATVVVTRARGQAAEFTAGLRELGAAVHEWPVIEIREPEDATPLDDAIANLESYDWLLFTSVNGVERFVARLDASARDLRSLRARIAAIGPATRKAVEALHLKVDLVPEEYVAESLVAAFRAHNLAGRRVLLPRAAVARDTAPEALRAAGAMVDVVEAYRTVMPAEARTQAPLAAGAWITFTSSSTVRNAVEAAGVEAIGRLRIASIGPVTSATCRELGLAVEVEAARFTTAGLLDALLAAHAWRAGSSLIS
jgi:uroporphyrinogen III methyltransferase/synthase